MIIVLESEWDSALTICPPSSFVDQYSTNESSRSPEHGRIFVRVSACLSALEGILKGSSSFSPIRRYSISLIAAACMDLTALGRFANDDMMAVDGHLNDLYEISSVEEILRKACDCSFLYFYRDIYPGIFGHMYETCNSSIGYIPLVLSSLSDPEQILRHVKHINSSDCVADYQSSLLRYTRERLVTPICEAIEANLRCVLLFEPFILWTVSILTFYSRLAYYSKTGQQRDDEEFSDRHVRSLLLSQPFYICQKRFDLKAEVEDELGNAFYDLCADSLNDYNAYVQMRSIANERYGISIMEPYLPDGSSDQRFDVLDFVRDFDCKAKHEFVSCCGCTLTSFLVPSLTQPLLKDSTTT